MQEEKLWITPNWPAPSHVKALTTLRQGGVSVKPFDSFNLGDHVGDDPKAVLENRQQLIKLANIPSEPCWINQVHGITVIDLADYPSQTKSGLLKADASISFKLQQVCCVLTADCLPVLVCDRAGTKVAAIHAGWRGLAQGVIQATIEKLKTDPQDLLVWLGPAIGPKVFEVGEDVRKAFTLPGDDNAFKSISTKTVSAKNLSSQSDASKKWLADLYALARVRLQALGIRKIYGGDFCTYSEEGRFFSFRRANPTGRQATLIWLNNN